jgi:quercetin dioxygenase-like cupin family protein
MFKRSFSAIPVTTTRHKVGEKRVLLAGNETDTSITQIAHTSLKAGENVEMHTHPDMEEYFYFLRGEVIVVVNDEKIPCQAGDFIQLCVGEAHALEVVEDTEIITIGCYFHPQTV